MNKYIRIFVLLLLFIYISISSVNAQYNFQSESIYIKNVNGKLYSYIVLLFNENPHFVNLIQKDSIPLKIIGNQGFHVKEYKNYIKTIKEGKIKNIAKTMMLVYLEPDKFNSYKLKSIEKSLRKRNIIIKFSKNMTSSNYRIILDYCIYGEKTEISLRHPLLSIKEKIFNIKPFLYYDEFSTSNSTFYFDMIYINPDEVYNDYIIARNIINGVDIKSMFFVGSLVDENIKYCLKKAFSRKFYKKSYFIKKEIWRMFVLHELTHKILNNRYNYFDQITGEELSLSTTVYSNPYLGLSVMYSYLNYNAINPHRIAATKFVNFISKRLKRNDIINDLGLIKTLPRSELRKLSKEHFNSIMKKLK
ncbi:hypothetical protein ACFL20_09885 [Spirochaetota bacterium]